MNELYHGDCLEILKTLSGDSVEALITDPPAGIGFMNQEWDKDKGGRDAWIAWLSSVMIEAKHVMKPGAHGLVWALPKTSHWTAMALENAGFQVRDCVSHIFGSGFPKSLSLDKAIDKHFNIERIPQLRATKPGNLPEMAGPIALGASGFTDISEPITEQAKQWKGWGSALKPSLETWWLIRKPFEGTIADNVLKYGVGGLNINASRVGDELMEITFSNGELISQNYSMTGGKSVIISAGHRIGRWPAHLLLTHHADCKGYCVPDCPVGMIGDEARFFYCAKPGTEEKEEGLDDGDFEAIAMGVRGGISGALKQDRFEAQKVNDGRKTEIDGPYQRGETLRRNIHPTIKSIRLMTYLIRLITPPRGIVLDPFMGSGSTGVAAVKNGYGFIGIEQHEPFYEIAKARIEAAQSGQMRLGI